MVIIVAVAVACIIALQLSRQIPDDAVGGSLVIALVVFVGALAMGIHEAWTNRRGVIGWLVNIIVSFFGAFFAAQLGGFVAITVLSPMMGGSSLAKSGGPVLMAGLILVTIIALACSWAALQITNKFR